MNIGKTMNDSEEFLTKDLGLACSLMCDNVRYLRVEKDPEDARRLVFVFEKSDSVLRVQTERANGTHVVSSTNYEDCMRRLKSIIHSV